MEIITHIYSLSEQLMTVNQELSSDIILSGDNDLQSILTNKNTNVVIFNWSSFDAIKMIINTDINDQNTQFVCIEKDINSEDRYFLLNYSIKFLSTDNFFKISANDFIHWTKLEKYKVLMLEDDIVQALNTEAAFKSASFQVKTIQTNIEVLESIKFYQPDLLLIVLNLEDISGDEFVKLIRKNPENLSLPIVFLSSDFSEESKQKVLNVGADEVLLKPISNENLISSLIKRMQSNFFQQLDISEEIPESKSIYHTISDVEYDNLINFISNNKTNRSASIIWIKISNKLSLQKMFGLSGFKNLCQDFLIQLPMLNVNFSLKFTISEGIFAFASDNFPRGQARQWANDINQWLTTNYFSIRGKEFNIRIQALILADLPMKSNNDLLIYEVERLLINPSSNKFVTYIAEGEDQKHFYLIKRELISAIKSKNFKWLYQSIINTQDEKQEIFQLMLRVKTKEGKDLKGLDYIDIANKTGLLKLLDRFTLIHAIRMIENGENKNIKRCVLLNQLISDYESKKHRAKVLSGIENQNLPKNRLIFQFRQDMTQEHTSLLSELGKELRQVNILICLSEFDASPMAWNIAKSLNVHWLRLKPFDSKSASLHLNSSEYIGKVIKKSQNLGYKVMVSNIDSADLTANIWNLNADFIQGNFIQAPVTDLRYIETDTLE